MNGIAELTRAADQGDAEAQYVFRTPLTQALVKAGLVLDLDGLEVAALRPASGTWADGAELPALPLPIVHSEVVAAVGASARRVAEKVEELALAQLLANSTPAWNPWDEAAAPEKNVLLMAEQLRKNGFPGPYALIPGTRRPGWLDWDAAAENPPVTVRSVLPGLLGTELTVIGHGHVPTPDPILFQLTADVLRVVRGLGIGVYVRAGWDRPRVATISVLQVRNVAGVIVSR